MSKKVFLIITKSNWGGAQKYVYDLATSLPKNEFDIHVIFGGHGVLAEKLELAQIPTASFPSMWRDVNIKEDIKAFFHLIKLFKKERPQIVHLNSSKIGGLGALAARIARVPKIVFTVHGYAFNEERPWLQKKIISFLSWFTVILCTDVICISKVEYEKTKAWPLAKNKVHLIYNGITAPDFYSKEESLSQLGISPHSDKKIVGTIGELTTNKGYLYALEAIKDIPEILYVIIGEGDQESTIKRYIKEHQLEEKVFLAGFVQDASRSLRAFDIFLLPSLKEGMPYVLLEAGHAALPIIATDVGGISEMIPHSAQILISAHSSEAIITTLQYLISNEAQQVSMGHAAKNYVENTYSIKIMIEKIITVYNS